MKIGLTYLIVIVLGLFFFSCTNSAKKEQLIKCIDSLQTVLSLKQTELCKIDTIQLNKAITRFKNYSEFIHQNISDTLALQEAETINLFYTSGKNLENFNANKISLLTRISLINSQLTKLKLDVQGGNYKPNVTELLVNEEKAQTKNISEIVTIQLQNYISNLQTLKNSLYPTEVILKNKNGGNLPTVINTSSDF